MNPIAINTEGLVRRFGRTVAVDHLNLAVSPRSQIPPGGAERRRQNHLDQTIDEYFATERREFDGVGYEFPPIGG